MIPEYTDSLASYGPPGQTVKSASVRVVPAETEVKDNKEKCSRSILSRPIGFSEECTDRTSPWEQQNIHPIHTH